MVYGSAPRAPPRSDEVAARRAGSSVTSESRGVNRDMDVAVLISAGVIFVLFILIIHFLRSQVPLYDQKIVLECEKQMEKRFRAQSQEWELMKAEFDSLFVKFTRLHSRSLRFKQEDDGRHAGAPGRPAPLTREDVQRILATGAWRTSSAAQSERPSPE